MADMIPPSVREKVWAVAKGSYQLDLLHGRETWSGSSLKGKAKKWGLSYAKSRTNLVDRINEVIKADGWLAYLDHVMMEGDVRLKSRLMLVADQGRGKSPSLEWLTGSTTKPMYVMVVDGEIWTMPISYRYRTVVDTARMLAKRTAENGQYSSIQRVSVIRMGVHGERVLEAQEKYDLGEIKDLWSWKFRTESEQLMDALEGK